MICTPDLLHNIKDFTINTFEPLLSDKHSPINISINIENNSHTSTAIIKEEISTDESFIKCKWEDSKKVEFQMSFDESKINDIYHTLSSVNSTAVSQDTINTMTNSLKEILLEPAKATGMYKEHRPANNHKKRRFNKPWFNNECKSSKKTTNNLKNLYINLQAMLK